jgi:hypothetical protein
MVAGGSVGVGLQPDGENVHLDRRRVWRRVVVMRYWADLSVEQVADLLGCSTGNVKSQSARALGKLRAVLGEDGARKGPRKRRDSRDG